MAAYKGNTVTHVEVLERLHTGKSGTEFQPYRITMPAYFK